MTESSSPTPSPSPSPSPDRSPTATEPPARPAYPFFKRAARILNSGQSRSILLCGNVHDLFCASETARVGEHHDQEVEVERYIPIGRYLASKWQVEGIILMTLELNGPIRFGSAEDREAVKKAWVAWRSGKSYDELVVEGLFTGKKGPDPRESLENRFEIRMQEVVGNPTLALEFLRQLHLCSRSRTAQGKPYLRESLLTIVEAADMLIPEGAFTSINQADRHRVSILFDWFSDPGFQNAQDSVILVAESLSLLHHRVARLPSVLPVEVRPPDPAIRAHFIGHFLDSLGPDRKVEPWGSRDELVRATAGLSIQAIRQVILGAVETGRIEPDDVVVKVQEYFQKQLGEDVVEFKRPRHTLDDLVGFLRLRRFLREELLPRFRSTGADALPGAAVCGPIGGGKTFIFEAVANALGFPVLVLKNIRSQYFGQTDVVFERLRRALMALGKVMIFVDEADTQFGGVGADVHSTERRLTGKIQAMISDPQLRGKVVWLLMTARVQLLSPDLRRPGRVGDLIIPVLDPQGEDREAFLRWVLAKALGQEPGPEEMARLDAVTQGYSPAAFASLRSQLLARTPGQPLSPGEIVEIVHDQIPPNIGLTRRYQTLQALVNCTRRSLLPDPQVTDAEREAWQEELRALEARGIS